MDFDTQKTLALILSKLDCIENDLKEVKTDVKDLKQGQEEMKQQLATVMVALNNSNADLTAKDEELEAISRQHSHEIMKLKSVI